MKSIAPIIFMLMICTAPAVAGEPWSKGEISLEATFLTLQYIDYKQTLFIAANDEYTENCIFLGKHPSEKQVNIYFLTTALVICSAF